LGTLDSNDYKFSVEDEILRVSKGSFIVMKGKKVNILYVLQDSMMTGVATVSLLENSNLDDIRL